MKTKYLLTIVSIMIIIIFLSSCKEEAIVEQKKENNVAQSTLAKGSDVSSVQGDSTILQIKKERVKRLKKEHEKPYMVIEKPEKILADLLKSRVKNKTLSKSSKNNDSYSVQSSQSCYTLEVDVWVFEKYHSKPGFNVGIFPKTWWRSYIPTLTTLKETYGFNKILMGRNEIDNQTVYAHNQIVAGVDPLHPYWAKTSYVNFQPRDLYAFYMDEPAHSLDPAMRDSVSKLVSDLRGLGFTSSLYMAGETCEILAHKVDDLVDIINMTAYTDLDYDILFGCHRNIFSDDQRDIWTDYNNAFGSKFNHLWVSGELDRGEMDQLTGHAQNLGKNSIWLYAGEEGMSDQSYWDAIGEFNYYAFIHGYLRREERRFIYVYYYVGYDDPCYDYQITSWELGDIIDTGETRIL